MNPDDVYSFRPCVELFTKDETDEGLTAFFLFQDSRKVITFDVSKETIQLFCLIDGTKSVKDICDEVSGPDDIVLSLIQVLIENSLIELIDQQKFESGEFERQINFLSNFAQSKTQAFQMQQMIANAHVAIIGLGGIGSWVFEFLVRSGVSKFTLIDPDIVELNNLHRQSIFTSASVGNSKATEAIKWAESIFDKKVDATILLEFLTNPDRLTSVIPESCSIVINCADEPDVEITNGIVSEFCHSNVIPYIVCGGYDGHLSFVGQTVIPNTTSCWVCYTESGVHEQLTGGYTHIPLSKEQVKGGTIAPVSSITASIQALEALKVITGFAQPSMANRRGEFDFTTMSMTYIDIERISECSLCGESHETCH
jgi:molybdopterin/thiamine biosynthesis adenylyltransferase